MKQIPKYITQILLKKDKASNMNLLFFFFLKIKINKIKSKSEVRGLTQREFSFPCANYTT